MDELTITSKSTRYFVSKIIEFLLRKKLGYKVHVRINSLLVNITDEKAKARLDIYADIDGEEFKKLVKGIESDME